MSASPETTATSYLKEANEPEKFKIGMTVCFMRKEVAHESKRKSVQLDGSNRSNTWRQETKRCRARERNSSDKLTTVWAIPKARTYGVSTRAIKKMLITMMTMIRPIIKPVVKFLGIFRSHSHQSERYRLVTSLSVIRNTREIEPSLNRKGLVGLHTMRTIFMGP